MVGSFLLCLGRLCPVHVALPHAISHLTPTQVQASVLITKHRWRPTFRNVVAKQSCAEHWLTETEL